MQGVHSEPSLGASTGKKNTSQGSHITAMTRALQRGSNLWEGRVRKITECLLMLVWKNWWNILVLATIIFKYVLNFLGIFRMPFSYKQIIYPCQIFCEAIYFIDVVIHILHNYWSIVRLHIRIFRRSLYTLLYDIISLLPIILACQFISKFYYTGITCQMLTLIGRCLVVGRIYRVIMYFRDLNGEMQKSRRLLFLLEHTLLVILVLHASTCLWNALNQPESPAKPWYNLGFPTRVRRARLTFQNYLECWYYSAGRFFNVIFGDSFPCNSLEKWLTSFLMLFGFVLMRYQFVGMIAWDMIVHLTRWSQFVDRYHHMTKYLKSCGAPPCLIEQAKNYKLQLWQMKKGVLTSDHLQQLPHPLQMELIFDINVGHFHRSILLGDTGEPFMRQLALVMRHELYLAGQQIWNQGVVKSGLIVIKQGVVELLSDEDDESPIIAFKEGTVLGELSLFHSIPAKVSVRAATYVEVQVLRRTDFMRVVLENPLVLHDVRNKIEKRVKNSRARQERISEYDSNDSRLIRTRYRPMKVFQDHLAGVKDEDPTFVDDSHLYYRDKNNQRLPKFTDEYLELYKLCNNVTTVDSPRIVLNSNFPWILEADTDLVHAFDVVHFFMVLYVCITSPLRAIGFSTSETQKVIDIIIMAGLLLNIYRQLTTCIVKKNMRKVTVKEIAEEKMSSLGFYMDIISVFPMYIFIETLFPDRDSMWVEASELFPVLQIWHLWDYCSKWQRNFDSNTKLLIVLRFAIMQSIFCYWSGAFLYMYSCPKRQCHKSSWMAQLILLETKVFVTNHAQHEHPITTSLGFGTAVFTGSGIGELAPGTYDLWVVVILFVVGAYMQIFYIARICATCLLSTKRKLMFTESMRELFYFLTVNRVSAKIKARVKKFFGVQWYYNQAVSVDEIFKDMSVNIQQEVLCIEMVETLLHCPLFQDCSRDFLQTVAGCVTTVVLPEDEIVQHAADISRDMYILQKGHCNMLNNSGKIVGSLAPGSHFGVVEMMFCLPKVHTVVTATNCVLRHMEYSSLLQCWSTFPEINQPILVVLQNPELLEMAAEYEDAKPLTGRIEVKVNRFAREIKDSFVMLYSPEDKRDYHREFDKLGILRYMRYVFLPISITPYGIFLKCWSGLRFLIALYYMFIIPYNIAIQRHRFNSKYIYSDIFLYFDLIVMSYVGYYDDKCLLVKHPLFTVSRYIKTTFFWDVIAVFPFEQLFRIVNESVDLDLFRLNRICLVTRLTGAFTYWESNIMNINPAVVMFKFLPLAMTFVNFMTAFIFMNSCKSFMKLVNDTNIPTHYIYVNCSKTLIMSTAEKNVQAVALNEYVYTGFWVVILFMGCGCAPILLTGASDALMVMLVQIVGLLYFAFMVGYMISLRSASAHALLEHTVSNCIPRESDLEQEEDSEHDSISGFEMQMEPHVQLQRSFTDMSMAKSHSSVGTYQSYLHVHNLIRPGSWLYQGFGYLCCLMATINYVLVSYQIVTLNDCKILFWMQGALDIFFYVKIYLNIHQAFVNKRGVIVVDPNKCRRQYCKRKWWMWSDILTNTPFELLGFAFPNCPRAMHYLRCTKLLRLKYLVEFYKKTSAELTNNLTILQAMTTLFVVILLVHTLTCVWLLVLMANSPICFLRRVKMYLFDNKDLPHHRWDYTTSFYVIVSELTGTGGDEFVIEEIKAFVILSLSVVCGKMLAAMIVATCIQLSYSAKSALINYERNVGELVDVLRNQGLSNYQLKKYWMYIKQLWVYERGRQLPVLLAQTPHVRRCDLMSAMFGHHLQNCFLFADTGEHFLRQLTAVLTYTTFFPGNYIVAAGDSEACMYWVTQGTVSVLSVRTDLTETTHELLGPGDVFGILQGLTRGIMHCFSYRAETKVGILTLCLDAWINILPYFPQAQNIINARSEVLYAQF
ncbi:uncharacterized protein LOC113228654 [Hyposmocoma kahamanoa]|uniref:uncharacterized protein LOC113228654 n=1 Tax=Hyposmocoma kahamanoa TaxID=1477025 RepID=UPI000E6DA3DD|nr:uncharacterized protein LOC113228654 [Hyposmocoma kahamanoa]